MSQKSEAMFSRAVDALSTMVGKPGLSAADYALLLHEMHRAKEKYPDIEFKVLPHNDDTVWPGERLGVSFPEWNQWTAATPILICMWLRGFLVGFDAFIEKEKPTEDQLRVIRFRRAEDEGDRGQDQTGG